MADDPQTAAVLGRLADAIESIIEDATISREDRARFGQESRDAHTATAGGVARVDGKLDALGLALTASRIELASATAAFTASREGTAQTIGLLRNLIYAGATVLVMVTGALLYATLTLRGIDAAAAMQAGRSFATPSADRGTTPEHGAPTDAP